MLSYFKANKKEEKTKFELDGQKPKTYLELWDIKLELKLLEEL